MALSKKQIETRHWSTNYRGRLAIHAAKVFSREQRDFTRCNMVSLALEGVDVKATLGHILCIVDLYDVRPTEYLMSPAGGLPASEDGKNIYEYEFGNYESGRYGWMTRNVQRLAKPLPVIGRQGLFRVDDALLEDAEYL